MDWSNFEHAGESPCEAFETLTSQLFERFCRREYRRMLRDVCFVEGKGGDGGVEAYAILTSGDVVGLQAKWFRDAFGDTQIEQIDHSLRTAVSVRSSLMRYIVAIPRDLGDDTTSKLDAENKKPGRPKKSQRQRWNEWVARIKAEFPRITVEHWGDAQLEAQLGEHKENEGLHAYWFSRSVFTFGDIERRFATAKAGWLRERYVPDLHATNELERDLGFRLGMPHARAEFLQKIRLASETVEATRDAIARLERTPSFLTALPDARPLLTHALDALASAIGAAKNLESAVSQGSPILESIPVRHEQVQAIFAIHDALHAPQLRRHSLLDDAAKSLDECVTTDPVALEQLFAYWRTWRNTTTKIVAYTGLPGVGKTYALASVVDSRLKAGQPALLLRAKECPVSLGWPEIFRHALDQPTMSLPAILNAMEATAARANVRRLRNSETEPLPAGIGHEPTCFLIAIDGLDESAQHAAWAERLRELVVHVEDHPRIRVAVTLRTSARDEILGAMRIASYNEFPLPVDGDVQTMLPRYCDYYRLPLPSARIRWALRDPLSLRLFCESSRNGVIPTTHKDAALVRLFRAKLERVQKKIYESLQISASENPLHTLLAKLAQRKIAVQGQFRDDVISDVSQSKQGRVTGAQWAAIVDHAEQEGLVQTWEDSTENLLETPRTYITLAYEPLVDYFLALAAKDEVLKALPTGGASDVFRRLAQRPDAIVQAATLLADAGVDLRATNLWPDEFNAWRIDTCMHRAIASVDDTEAAKYTEWVRERLVKTMPSCRRVLAELCIPMARDEAHPFGPHFVHETLMPYLPAKRDLFWSGPRVMRGEDESHPWAGQGVEALELLRLEPDDTGGGAPLLLGWALTSVDGRWRRRLRAELARWGAGNLPELIRWLEFVMQTNDPQMAEDAAMVAFGAACLAGTHPDLAKLAAWTDEYLLAPKAKGRREDIIVLHAARGIIERARVMGFAVSKEMLDHARTLYSTAEDMLPIDAQAAKEADDVWGISPLTWDLAGYVVPAAIRPFFSIAPVYTKEDIGGRAARILSLHAQMVGLESLSPQKFAFGVVLAHLQAMGWTAKESFGYTDGASHGQRSPVCGLSEKYTWTARHALQAYLAGRLPIVSPDDSSLWIQPPVEPVLISRLLTNPVSEMSLLDSPSAAVKPFWPNDELTPRLDLQSHTQLARANEWVMGASEPSLRELREWLIVPSRAAPRIGNEDEWVTLACEVTAREHDSQAESRLNLRAMMVRQTDADVVRANMDGIREAGRFAKVGRYAIWNLVERGEESIRGYVYMDPSESLWAPWIESRHSNHEILVHQGSQGDCSVDLAMTTAGIDWDSYGEHSAWMPSQALRKALGLIDVKVVLGAATEWQFMDRAGDVQAVYSRSYSNHRRSEVLLVRRTALEKTLVKLGKNLVWAIGLARAPAAMLFPDDDDRAPWVKRNFESLAFLSGGGIDVLPLPGSGTLEFTGDKPISKQPPEEPTPQPISSVVQMGPSNPDFAVPLSSELDDDQAIPYFLWDEPMTVAEFKHKLASASVPERNRLLGLLLREARDPDVWQFTTPEEVDTRFDAIAKHLGRRKRFWEFLLGAWRKEGLLGQKSA